MSRVLAGSIHIEINVVNYTTTAVTLSGAVAGVPLRVVYSESFARPRDASGPLRAFAEVLAGQLARAAIDQAERVFEHVEAQAPTSGRERRRRLSWPIGEAHDPIRRRWAS